MCDKFKILKYDCVKKKKKFTIVTNIIRILFTHVICSRRTLVQN